LSIEASYQPKTEKNIMDDDLPEFRRSWKCYGNRNICLLKKLFNMLILLDKIGESCYALSLKQLKSKGERDGI
jgi:hypothetical protein